MSKKRVLAAAAGALIGREAILAAKDLKTERVPVPEWGNGAEVIVSEFSAEARDEFWAGVAQERGKQNLKNIRARLAVLVIVDETGQRVFGDEDARAVGAKSAIALNRIWNVATRLNGLTVEVEAAVEKNS